MTNFFHVGLVPGSERGRVFYFITYNYILWQAVIYGHSILKAPLKY